MRSIQEPVLEGIKQALSHCMVMNRVWKSDVLLMELVMEWFIAHSSKRNFKKLRKESEATHLLGGF